MRTALLTTCLLLTTAPALAAPDKAEGFKVLDLKGVDALLAGHEDAVFLDANTPEFRAAHGVVPGARLLTSSSGYDVAKELPASKDTPLVFYCSNSH